MSKIYMLMESQVGVLKEDVQDLERIVEPVIHNMSTKKESRGK